MGLKILKPTEYACNLRYKDTRICPTYNRNSPDELQSLKCHPCKLHYIGMQCTYSSGTCVIIYFIRSPHSGICCVSVNFNLKPHMTVCGGGTFWSPPLPLPRQEEMQQNELIGGECVGVGGGYQPPTTMEFIIKLPLFPICI